MGRVELRCGAKLHAVLVDGLLEVKCNSNRCGVEPGILVFHYYSPVDGELIRTRKFRDPAALRSPHRRTSA